MTPRSYSATILTTKNQTMKPHGGMSRKKAKPVRIQRTIVERPPSFFRGSSLRGGIVGSVVIGAPSMRARAGRAV